MWPENPFTRRRFNGALMGAGALAAMPLAAAAQNVYLYCASEGLASVFRGPVDHDKLGRAMRLGDGQFVAFAQTVGYPRA